MLQCSRVLQRFIVILALSWFAALGSGALEYLHNAQHARQDAAMQAAARAAGKPYRHSPLHDDSNCGVHLQLHFPLIAYGFVMLLSRLGLLIAILAIVAAALRPRAVLARIDCRGPPA
ncbi:MAG: hypothetical protein JWL69_758 [Phycisphaerales bacterium]|nr:hypothetical protein [Phycisphaerales bacterium]MDB5358352.1 hypothetical protein [Phycisphaerales bacterium]